ncbi:cupin domain-containing protein [Methanocella sp. CWC-04]|uniref:Cupin domain-containing protein n=1 Tax=Methanooceanicella nereidis TaxID=2052831 RepID=A0AAP2W5S6_9EURY|nr:cupin domain-containing protein [Methanocella sp. CWC-04]MCD1293639.1 cupin domain-containing protein [Methanocella sp. CWC-04]
MGQKNAIELFSSGSIIFPGKYVDAAKLPWYEHPAFMGVFLKDLVTAADTRGAFSCHIVKIKKGFDVGEHSHNAEWEFNETLEGTGFFVINGKKYACTPGFSYATPPGMTHIVSAPNEDVYLLAKFIPALK